MTLGRLEEWGAVNLMKFNKTRARGCTQVRTVTSISTDWVKNGLRAAL